jgi:diaminohydroxyphosphoribosylaminopyrimidine deaminase/5-amino-6-(5-phosphoribosylamino)uracil reductase
LSATNHEIFIKRCFDLAKLGAGKVSPNPLVGAVIVYQNKIISESYHQTSHKPHAEVLAIANVPKQKLILLKESTLYISHVNYSTNKHTTTFIQHILENKIPRVVISSLGDNTKISEQNLKILSDAGVIVITNILPEKGSFASVFSHTFTTIKRPYIVLKYAQTLDGFLAQKNAQQFWISNSFSKRLVHKWRSEIDAILVGTNTALHDNPKLDTRLYFGKSPLRIVFDQHNRLPKELNLFDGKHNTLLINKKHDPTKHIKQIQLSFDDQMLKELLSYLHSQNISSLLVEGGTKVLQSFIDQNLWDEARIFVGNKHLNDGIKAPQLPYPPDETHKIFDDQLFIHYNK